MKKSTHELKREDLMFDVEMRDVKEATGMTVAQSHLNKMIVTTDSDGTERIVNFCSEWYSLVPIADILIPLEKVLKSEGVKYKATYKHHNHCRFYVDYVIEGIEKKIQKADSLNQRISIRHSYDGQMTFSINHGIYRQICSNGMMGWSSDFAFSRKHSSGLTAETIEEMTFEMVASMKDSFEEAVEVFEVLAERKVEKWADRLLEVLNAVSGTPKRFAEEIEQVIMKESAELKVPVTDWLIFNGINYQLNHNQEIKKTIEHREKVDAKVLDYMLKTQEVSLS